MLGAAQTAVWFRKVVLLPVIVTFIAACSPHAEVAESSVGNTSPVQKSQKPAEVWQIVGTSVEGRPLRVRSLGEGSRRVFYIGGIHGDEPEGAFTTAELPAAFSASGSGSRVTLTILEDANPDGRARKTRANANGVDLNRNFPASNFDTASAENGASPLNQPESRVLNDLIEQVQPNLVIAMHSWTNRQFINYDGPARSVAERFSAESGLPMADSSSLAATPGSLGSYLGRDLGVPVITVELRKGSDSKASWETIRKALLNAIDS